MKATKDTKKSATGLDRFGASAAFVAPALLQPRAPAAARRRIVTERRDPRQMQTNSCVAAKRAIRSAPLFDPLGAGNRSHMRFASTWAQTASS